MRRSKPFCKVSGSGLGLIAGPGTFCSCSTSAYDLTRGQPLLLQMLGAELVNRRNEQKTRRGEARSDYVDTNDFAAAVEGVVRAGTNAAFENHWEESNAATHRILSALAWATDEAARTQRDIAGLESAMHETRLTLPCEQTFPILERLTDDEILERDGPTYRFWVPLYRRWVAWRWRRSGCGRNASTRAGGRLCQMEGHPRTLLEGVAKGTDLAL